MQRDRTDDNTTYISVVTQDVKCKASSVLDGKKCYRASNVLDYANATSCWNSAAHGLPQILRIEFPARVNVDRIQMCFQGGFVGKDMNVYVQYENDQKYVSIAQEFEVDDSNDVQSFDLMNNDAHGILGLQLVFQSSFDFYGRITMYRLDLLRNGPRRP